MALSDRLTRLRSDLEQIGGSYRLEIDGLSAKSETKLGRLDSSGRPFLRLGTSAVRDAVLRFVRAQFSPRSMPTGREFQAAVRDEGGRAVKTVVLLRFREQGNDVRLRPLDPDYRRWKSKHGYDTRIGIKRGDLLADLQAAEFRLVKR
jgi:hypothetical protein